MPIYLIDVHHHTHTCPGTPDPHPFDTRRTIVAALPRQRCTRPVTVRSGNATAVIDCGRHNLPENQCAACRPQITRRHVTATHTGHNGGHR